MPKKTGHEPRQAVSSKLRKAFKCKHGQVHKKQPELLRKAKALLLKNIPETFDRQDSLTATINATAEHLAGESQAFVEKKYGLARSAVSDALNLFFPSTELRRAALKNLLLDGALQSAVIFRQKAEAMTAPQAAITAGILSQRYVELEKAEQNNFKEEIPVALVIQLEATIQKVKQVHGKTIDI